MDLCIKKIKPKVFTEMKKNCLHLVYAQYNYL